MFRIWARKDALDQIAYAKEVGPKMLEYFEEYFNVTYPLPKQDMIAIPDFRSVHVFTEQFLPSNLPVRYTGTFNGYKFLLIKFTNFS